MQFLMGLNETYSAVRGQILLMDPIPVVKKAFSLVFQEERQRGIVSPRPTHDSAALSVKGNNNPGHTKEKCYKLHGFPLGHKLYKERPTTAPANQASGNQATANQVSAALPTNNLQTFPFTSEQCQQILALINSQPMSLLDQSLKKMIGAGRLHEGLYLFESPTIVLKSPPVVASSIYSLWHHRLGHPSHSRLQLLSKYIPTLNFNAQRELCETCSLAKQTRLPFPLSIKTSVSPFDLIHCDIWGKYHHVSLSGAHYFLTIVDDYTRCTWIFLMQYQLQ
ncbi:uncharacterized protein LOC21412662 [Morus notabilis]|uniref:uncharacterized protein LOC21412662 n=1 Tax=Morus notabilis TaxID=981085 RepID=UPI000CED17E7|nr:uncharacterized protein LOC21412662 [Morus notabilis]